VKKFLEEVFDHTLLLNDNDPLLEGIQGWAAGDGSEEGRLAKIIAVPNCGMEGLAKFVLVEVTKLIDREVFDDSFERHLRPLEVVCWEDGKNRATYHPA